ncbi:MAG: family 43 glycosylhydrolase [Lachnospiraceae bacterium]|nr:family 43 glycosylhydrolase [Lachnospiraceae bacterium]
MKAGFKIITCTLLSLALVCSQMCTGFGIREAKADNINVNENAIYRIVNKSSGKVLDVKGGSSDNNTTLQTYSSNNSAAQQFKFIKSVSHGYYCIIPQNALSKALDDPNHSRDSGVIHQIYAQNGKDAQDYTVQDAGNGYVRIVARCSGYALTDEGDVKQRPIGNDDRQLWKIEVVRTTNCFVNPIRSDGADPWVVKAGDSYYYCQSSGGVALYKMDDLTQFGIAQYNNIFANDVQASDAFLSSYWAPECIWLRGHWYSYFAPETNRNGNDSHRTYVLEGGTNPNNPLDGAYTLKGRLADWSADKWSIDTTAFEYNGKLYCVWSGWEGDVNVVQKLYIAEMSNPWTMSSRRVCISTPTYGWETNSNPQVNEGPEVLIRNGKVHIIYSASGSWMDSYCLARITCTNGNLLDPNSWSKGSEPVFQQTSDVHGVGHASFTKSPDGTEDWIVYHAAKRSGAGWDRDVHIQYFTWHDDYPFFGEPVSNGVELGRPSQDSASPVVSNHYYVVKNLATGRCLDIPNGEDKNSLKLQTWTINKSNAQQFKFNKKSDGWYTMIPKCAQGRGLDNPSGSRDKGLQYQTWELNNNKAQNFRLEKVADGTYRIINQASLFALTDKGEGEGYKVTQEAITNNNNQRWVLIDITAEEQQTEPPTEAPTDPPSDGYTTGTVNEWSYAGNWGLYYGDWAGTANASYKADNNTPFSIKVNEANKGAQWLVQGSYQTNVTSGHTYKVSVDVTSSKAAQIGMKEDLSNGEAAPEYTTVSAGSRTTLTGTYTVSQDQIKIMFELGLGVDAGTTIDFNSVKIEDITNNNQETSTSEQVPDGPIEVFGLLVKSDSDNTITVTWGQNTDQVALGQKYNVYVDGVKELSEVPCGSYTITDVLSGNHTVKVTATLNGNESNGLNGMVEVSGSSVIETEKPTEAPTEIPTEAPTETPTEAPTETPTEAYTIEGGIEINGYQISAKSKGFRTVYSVEPEINGKEVVEAGLVYALTDYIIDSNELYVGNTNPSVASFAKTAAGKISNSFSESQSAQSYAMTMKFATANPAEYTAAMAVRAYAKLSDGSYVYSGSYSYSFYDVAEKLYRDSSMNTIEAHNYLYNDIIKLVTPEYKPVEYTVSDVIN